MRPNQSLTYSILENFTLNYCLSVCQSWRANISLDISLDISLHVHDQLLTLVPCDESRESFWLLKIFKRGKFFRCSVGTNYRVMLRRSITGVTWIYTSWRLLQTILSPGGSGLSSVYSNLHTVFLCINIQYFMLHTEFFVIFVYNYVEFCTQNIAYTIAYACTILYAYSIYNILCYIESFSPSPSQLATEIFELMQQGKGAPAVTFLREQHQLWHLWLKFAAGDLKLT